MRLLLFTYIWLYNKPADYVAIHKTKGHDHARRNSCFNKQQRLICHDLIKPCKYNFLTHINVHICSYSFVIFIVVLCSRFVAASIKKQHTYGTDLMQRCSFACVRMQVHASLSGTTREFKYYHSRVRVSSLWSLCTITYSDNPYVYTAVAFSLFSANYVYN